MHGLGGDDGPAMETVLMPKHFPIATPFLATPQEPFTHLNGADSSSSPPNYPPNLERDLPAAKISTARVTALPTRELTAKGSGSCICLLIVMTQYHSLRAGIYLPGRGECRAVVGFNFTLRDGRGAQELGMTLCIGQEGDVRIKLTT